MKLGLEGRVALVTAASRGFGRAVALELAAEGAHVALCARGAEDLAQTLAEARAAAPAGVRLLARPCDVTDGPAVERLVAEVARLTRAFPPGSRHPFAPAFNPAQQPVLTLDSREIEQTQLALGIRTCSRHDPRRYALRLLNTILGENMSSRLFQILREDTGLTYSISSSLSFFEDVGDLVISAGLDTGNVPKALTLLAKELSRLRDKPPGKAELARARDYVIGQSNLSLEGTEHHMMWLGEQLLGYGKITRPAILKRALRQVTPAQIQSAARDFFHPGLLTLALVSPLKSAGHLQRYLRQL